MRNTSKRAAARSAVLAICLAAGLATTAGPAGADDKGGGAAQGQDDGGEALRFFDARIAAVAKSCGDKLWEVASSAKGQGLHQFAQETAEIVVTDWLPDHPDARALLGHMKKGKEWVADPKASPAKQNTKNEKESQKSFDEKIRKWKEQRAKVSAFIASRLAAVGDECAAKGYREQSVKAAERALSLDKDCAPARKLLGYEKFGAIWVTPAKAAALKRTTEGRWIEEQSDLEKALGAKLSKIETPHFRIEDDGAKEALPEAVRALETMYAYYLADVGRDPAEDVFGGRAMRICVVSAKPLWDKWVDGFSEAADKEWTKGSNTYKNYTSLRIGILRVETAEHVDTRDPMLHQAAHLMNHFVWKCARIAWIDEGLAYYYTVKLQETTRTSCLAKGTEGGYAEQGVIGGDKDWAVSERWKAYMKPLVQKKNDTELRKIMSIPLATLDLPSSVKAWGVISFLMDTRREKFIEFLTALKARKDPAAEPQEEIFQKVFGTSIEAVDAEWRAFVLRAY